MRFSAFAAAFSLAALTLTAAPLNAAPWKMDKAHSAITFEVEHLGFSFTPGQFREFDAEIDFDPENIESAKVKFQIRADSVDTNWPARDRHVRGKDFLDSGNNEFIVFESTKVRLTGPETATITGDFTLRGETREETFDATLKRIGPSPFNPNQTIAGFRIEGVIDRTEYGVSYGAPAIGAVIPVRIDLEISPVN